MLEKRCERNLIIILLLHNHHLLLGTLLKKNMLSGRTPRLHVHITVGLPFFFPRGKNLWPYCKDSLQEEHSEISSSFQRLGFIIYDSPRTYICCCENNHLKVWKLSMEIHG
uniref:Uncharacterized protein n=1 Tax=Micrurus corallinus TaxID=54390 RepID=A0A2D4EX74_MICCO